MENTHNIDELLFWYYKNIDFRNNEINYLLHDNRLEITDTPHYALGYNRNKITIYSIVELATSDEIKYIARAKEGISNFTTDKSDFKSEPIDKGQLLAILVELKDRLAAAESWSDEELKEHGEKLVHSNILVIDNLNDCLFAAIEDYMVRHEINKLMNRCMTSETDNFVRGAMLLYLAKSWRLKCSKRHTEHFDAIANRKYNVI